MANPYHSSRTNLPEEPKIFGFKHSDAFAFSVVALGVLAYYLGSIVPLHMLFIPVVLGFVATLVAFGWFRLNYVTATISAFTGWFLLGAMVYHTTDMSDHRAMGILLTVICLLLIPMLIVSSRPTAAALAALATPQR